MKKLLLFGSILILTICIVPVAALTAVNDYYTYTEGGCMGINGDVFVDSLFFLGDVQENDYPVAPPVTVQIVELPKHGGVDLTNIGSLYYKANIDFFGTDVLKYRLFNGETETFSNVATVYIKIVPYRPQPVRTWYYIPQDTLFSIPHYPEEFPHNPEDGICSGMLQGTPMMQIEIDSDVNHGTILRPGIGKDNFGERFEYMPDPGFTGWDKLTYRCVYDSAYAGYCWSPESELAIYVGDPPYSAPEFPSNLLPGIMVVGFIGAVFIIQRTKEK